MAMDSPAPADPHMQPPKRKSRSVALWVALAFAAGLVLFAIVLSRGKDSHEFFRSDSAGPNEKAPSYAPLPAPLPAGEDSVGLTPPLPDPAQTRRPELVEAPAAPPPPRPRAEKPPVRAASVQPQPIPGQTPPPRYPPQALRRGEQGTVIVRAEIGPDGVPTSTSLVAGSGSRTLDRAALEAVRQWRFLPAQENGRPAVGSVVVPIEFNRQ